MAFKFIIVTALLALATAGYAPQTYYAPAVVAKLANPLVDAVASTQQNVVRSFGGTVSQYSKSVHTPYSSVQKEDTRVNNNVYTPAIAKTVYSNEVATPVYEHASVYEHTPVYKQAQTVSYAAPTAAVYTTHATEMPDYSEQQHHVSEHHEENDGYTKEVSYAAPAAANTVSYSSSPVATVHNAHAESHVKEYSFATPAVHTKTVSYAAPTVTKTVSYASPAYATPAATYSSHYAPAAATAAAVYTQATPSSATVYQHATPSAATTLYNHGPAASTYSHNSPGVSAYGTTQTVRYSPANMVSHMSFDGFGTHWGY